MFVPCVYLLITSKSESIYLNVFHELIVLTKYNWMPQIITCDFELSLISAIKQEFPSSRLLCCYFHLKKAIERKLRKYKVADHNCRIILSNIELLTVVLIEEITTYFNCITTRINFILEYFYLTWRRRFEPQLWNISNINDNNIAGRTSNALERYNRRIGENFANAHPNLASFISIIRTKSL
ncbi:hypothetical protein HZS_5471 [Henneguya salminicola]|nr:hypothetical protein HZS_5471 [Henneguya salminicola]